MWRFGVPSRRRCLKGNHIEADELASSLNAGLRGTSEFSRNHEKRRINITHPRPLEGQGNRVARQGTAASKAKPAERCPDVKFAAARLICRIYREENLVLTRTYRFELQASKNPVSPHSGRRALSGEEPHQRLRFSLSFAAVLSFGSFAIAIDYGPSVTTNSVQEAGCKSKFMNRLNLMLDEAAFATANAASSSDLSRLSLGKLSYVSV
ncbi:hypothetical protein AXG93_2415s1220 [Marchantia polymorpha subsp. ruderalis]|uniref:Uncharacterized protein n=1 Tax=Marchantia polymorpha subsp. ruderalis TaxID=1480154 RepID=A0A176VVV5_MARPO|nr:hypothetical protein AXG93_2415s1220 [Marchantia polymorpha subsp. ruderalis]